MIFAVLCAFLVVRAAATDVKPWLPQSNMRAAEYWCGSETGQWHSYQGNFQQHGYVKRIEVWADEVINAIRMTHGNEPQGPKYGGPGGTLVGHFILGNEEYIMGVDIEEEEHQGQNVICRLTFVSSLARYGPYGQCRHRGFCGERTFCEPLQYVSVMYGEFINWMTFTH